MHHSKIFTIISLLRFLGPLPVPVQHGTSSARFATTYIY
jgi:hypothetical protein